MRRTVASPAGFTLMEVLVVLSIFAVIGVIASQILSGVLSNQHTLMERGNRLADVQRAMLILQRDIMQLNPRGVRDELGDPVDALLIGADGLLEFTRAGWRNPLRQRRSELQRVSYLIEDETLYRSYWPTLDRSPESEPVRQRMLDEVRQIEFFAIDVSGNEYSFWPQIETGEADNPATALAAIVMRIDLAPFGFVERIWLVPSL